MSDTNKATTSTKFKVGIFTVGGLFLVGLLTVFVNNRPFWWRSCDAVSVTVEDATGLKRKSPVKSLGLEIGYISDIGLVDNAVRLKLCVTAPVEMQADTHAYVRSEGFLGDRFLELKPVKYTGQHHMEEGDDGLDLPSPTSTPMGSPAKSSRLWNWLIPSAAAADTKGPSETNAISSAPVTSDTNAVPTTRRARTGTREIPVGEKAADVQQLVNQMNGLMKDLKTALNPDEIRGAIRQLNKTLEDMSKALSPQGGLTATAQRSLIKLEDAIEQLRDQVTRINQGQGSVGMVLNDPAYAEELKKALVNLNHLLNKASDMRLSVILGINQLTAYQATRASFQVQIFPKPDRFYLLGISSDPRGSITQTITTTQNGNVTTGPFTQTTVNKGGYAFTAMIGKVLTPRVDLSVGLLNGDGAASLGINMGWGENIDELQLKNEVYFRSQSVNGNWTAQPDARIFLIFQPYSIVFLTGGMEGFRHVNGQVSAFYGAGIRFEDEDIKLILSFL